MTPIESAVYPFEGVLPDLDAPPIAARRALDLVGVRLSIEGWRSLSIEDRQRLTLAGAADAVDGERVVAAVRRANPPPQRGPQGQDPDPTAPPEALARALEPNRTIDPRRWARLRSVDRYALVHTYRRAVARSSFMILGEACDAIFAMSAPSPQQPRAAPPPSSPAPAAPGGYLPPGAYSTVKTSPTAPIRPGSVPVARTNLSPWDPGSPASQTQTALQPAPDPRRTAPTPPAPPRSYAEEPVHPSARRTAPAPVVPPDDLPVAPPPPPQQISTHLSPAGEVHMVDVAQKPKTERRAVASAVVLMHPETAQRIARQDAPKGEVLATARIAGIMAAKRTPELIPLCHGLALTRVAVDIDVDVPGARVIITATAEAFDRTGVEMEAIVAASVAGLTIYDMLKGMDREMVMSEVKLLEKSGGRSGHYRRRDPRL